VEAISVTSQGVIRTYLMIAGLYTLSASVIWGVNTLFLLDAGLDIFEVFIANAAFTAGMVLFEIPTGVLADTAGRRASFLLSTLVIAAGTLLYVALAAAEAGLVAFCLASVLLGLGFTFYSGAVEAWLVDALKVSGYEADLDHVFARGAMVSGAAMLVGAVGGGVLGSIDLAWPYVVRAVLLVLLFVLAFRSMHDIGFVHRPLVARELPAQMSRVAKESITYGWKRQSVRLLIITSIIQGSVLAWAFYAWQPYLLGLLEDDAVWMAGVVAALIALSAIVGNSIVEFFTRFCGHRTTMLIAASGVMGVGAIGVGVADEFWLALAALLTVTTALGVQGPVRQAYLHKSIPSEQRATVVSFDSMLGSAGGVGGQVGLGVVSRSVSISAGYVSTGVVLLAAVPVYGALRRIKEPTDIFAGTKAGCQGPAAALGLPDLAAVDSIPRQPETVTE
jgi:MFS family permease